jgi:glycyl-tRNA synthetase alpha chain
LHRHFQEFEQEAKQLIEKKLVLPAYDYCLKASHAFNLLDARGAISVNERPRFIGRVRALAKGCAEGYLESRREQNFPLCRGLSQAKRAD